MPLIVGVKVLVPSLVVEEKEVASRRAAGECGQDDGRERGDLHDRCTGMYVLVLKRDGI